MRQNKKCRSKVAAAATWSCIGRCGPTEIKGARNRESDEGRTIKNMGNNDKHMAVANFPFLPNKYLSGESARQYWTFISSSSSSFGEFSDTLCCKRTINRCVYQLTVSGLQYPQVWYDNNDKVWQDTAKRWSFLWSLPTDLSLCELECN